MSIRWLQLDQLSDVEPVCLEHSFCGTIINSMIHAAINKLTNGNLEQRSLF
ncbi:hypothetical protein [Chroococcus sp. FPU101]|uniref:hypothetical protein n=1 Tax=Chroococcus sp. FPU101 TaxID=1974212 RepID=UPI001A8E65A2|nr:hypothetical protein [Chroococcus sp. FPU101]